jgi:hypothetical protein
MFNYILPSAKSLLLFYNIFSSVPVLTNLTTYIVHYHYILRRIAFSLCNIIVEIALLLLLLLLLLLSSDHEQ